MKKDIVLLAVGLSVICFSSSLIADRQKCEHKIETLLSRMENNVIDKLNEWNSYEQVKEIIHFIESEIESLEECESSLPQVTESESDFFFIHSTLGSVQGSLKFTLADFRAIPEKKKYSNKQISGFRTRFLSFYRDDVEPKLAEDIDEILIGLAQ